MKTIYIEESKHNESFKLHTSITRLSLDVFIDAFVDNDYSGLIISGEPSDEEIQNTWMELKRQYIEAIGDLEYKIRLSLIKDLKLIESDLEAIDIVLSILCVLSAPETIHLPGLNERLEKWRAIINYLVDANFDFDPTKPEQFKKDVESSITRGQIRKLNYEVKKKQLENMDKKNSSISSKPTREQFEENITILCIQYKLNLSSETISVFRYCDLLKKLNKHSK